MLVSLAFPLLGQSEDCSVVINGAWKGEAGNVQDNMFHSLAIDPSNENIVYAGTETSGIFKTTDGGSTWNRLRLGLKCGPQKTGYPQIFDIAIDPANPKILYASTVNGPGPPGNPLYPSASAGVYRSTDGGATWAQKVEGLTNPYAIYVLVDAVQPTRLYLGVGGVRSTFSLSLGTFYEGGIWSSDNGGDTWTPLTLPMGINSNIFIDMVLRGTDQKTIYASGQIHGSDAPTAYGLIRSTDGGKSWSMVNPAGTTLYGFDVFRGDPKIIYGHDSSPQRRAHKSTDGGDSWVSIPTASFYGAVRIHPDNSEMVYNLSRHGIQKSTDGLRSSRTTYTDMDQTENQQMLDIKIALTHPQIIWACAKGYYLYKSIDGGESFTRITAVRDTIYGNARQQVLPQIGSNGMDQTGLALLNTSTESAAITLTAYNDAGKPLDTGSDGNPAVVNLSGGSQTSRLITELFRGTGLANAWIRLVSNQPDISGFFLRFDYPLTYMDGAGLTRRPSPNLVFPEIQEAEMILLNPDPFRPASITIRHIHDNGLLAGRVQDLRLPANGRLRGGLKELVPESTQAQGGYLYVNSDLPLVGMEQFGFPGKFLSVLNALDAETGSRQIYSPQFVVGGGYKSKLTLINLESAFTTLSLTWLNNAGATQGRSASINLPALGRVTIQDPSLFGLDSTVMREGYVRIGSSRTILAGSVRFEEDSPEPEFGTALPLPATGRNELFFAQVAQDSNYFTGVALVNPNSQEVKVAVSIFNSAGRLVGNGQRVLLPNTRISTMLPQLDASLPVLSSGYFQVAADRPLLGFAVFGTHTLTALAALPPW